MISSDLFPLYAWSQTVKESFFPILCVDMGFIRFKAWHQDISVTRGFHCVWNHQYSQLMCSLMREGVKVTSLCNQHNTISVCLAFVLLWLRADNFQVITFFILPSLILICIITEYKQNRTAHLVVQTSPHTGWTFWPVKFKKLNK